MMKSYTECGERSFTPGDWGMGVLAYDACSDVQLMQCSPASQQYSAVQRGCALIVPDIES